MSRSLMNQNWLKGGEFLPENVRNWLESFWPADRFFDDDFIRGNWMPAVNIVDNKDAYEIEVAAPGFKKEDFDVKVESGMLVIAAEHELKKEEKEANYTRKEFGYSSFSRTFALPENVDEDDIRARYDDGILRLTMKKLALPEEKADAKKIAIT